MKGQHTGISEEKIVALLKNKDQRGIKILYQYYSPLIYGLIFKIVKREDAAEDALQDAFLKVWRNIDSYDRSKGKFIAWVIRVARNAAIDAKRSKFERQNTRFVPFTEVIKTDSTLSFELKVEHIGIREKLELLEKPYRDVIELTFFCGMTHTEAAKELNLPLGTVKSRIRKAFKELRIIFG